MTTPAVSARFACTLAAMAFAGLLTGACIDANPTAPNQNNDICEAQTCVCAAGLTCEIFCEKGPCAAECEEGSACLLDCPDGDAGEDSCNIVECGAGEITVCEGGTRLTCGLACE